MGHEKVLVVDDSAINRHILREILKNEDFDVIEATDGVEAIEQIQQKDVAMVLLDIMMPSKDGYQVCAEIQSDQTKKDVPVIFLSARTEMEDKLKGFSLGAVDYITKPFNHREVLARVRTHVALYRLSRSMKDAFTELQTRQNRIDEDLKAAAFIQKSLIPAAPAPIGSLQYRWQFSPCESVGGDIFNVFQLDADHTAVYLLDVSGHGVPSAMIAVSVSQILSGPWNAPRLSSASQKPKDLPTPAAVLRQLNQEFPFERFDKFFTMCYLLINHRTGHVRYCNAAHPSPLLIQKSGTTQTLDKGGLLVGVDPDSTYEEGEIQLSPGDRLILYTDGIVEYENQAGEPYGHARFQDQLLAAREDSLDTVCDRISNDLKQHGSQVPPQDDISLLILEFTEEKKS